MLLRRDELDHIVFLSEIVMHTQRKHLMPNVLVLLLSLTKQLQEAEVSEEIASLMRDTIAIIEASLREDNERMKEISGNLNYPSQRNPLG